ncbi:hypothetical protein P154DRAFT_522933 [Amniculicola lignicola CBS 123094]|uniref:Uncharacterized protein n=1 Tax=Amniculicola lignicola CBS 123094 TaxID=1392246 RepID=A0A6A5WI71_9PLEO|nr:hypothetical protein P154DRAFT_522933 [Amniculicola lignicola CBS 123094]
MDTPNHNMNPHLPRSAAGSQSPQLPTPAHCNYFLKAPFPQILHRLIRKKFQGSHIHGLLPQLGRERQKPSRRADESQGSINIRQYTYLVYIWVVKDDDVVKYVSSGYSNVGYSGALENLRENVEAEAGDWDMVGDLGELGIGNNSGVMTLRKYNTW